MPSTTPVISLDTKSVAGTLGTTVDFTTAKRIVSAVIIPSPTSTDGLIVIQASQDGLNWVDIGTVDILRGGTSRGFDNVTGAYRYWRANVFARINGGTVTVTFMEAG